MPHTWMAFGQRLRAQLLAQPRHAKRILLILNDVTLLSVAVWLAFSMRWGRLYVPENLALWVVLLAAPLIAVLVFHSFGLYQLVTRFLGVRGAIRIFGGIGLSVLVWALLVLMAVGTGDPRVVFPRSVVFIYAMLAGIFVWASRELAAYLLLGPGASGSIGSPVEKRRVVVFGAGRTGVQLVEALRRSGDYEPIGFVDDDPSLIGQHVSGLKVYKVDKLPRLVERDSVKEVMLALPEEQRRERRAIIQRLAAHPVRVKTLPAMEDIASGRVAVTDLKPVDVDDLLGRDPVPPDAGLLSRTIRGKSVMVTGAGGTIGAELTRQILRQGPACLVLYEVSESALYEVETEIQDALGKLSGATGAVAPKVVAVLGSVLDAALLAHTIERHRVETIYHAAAYKHVPIVEANPIAGLRNNTFGTAILAEVAAKAGVERVALISTDKAVRPTNIMGASKRLAELVFQAAAEDSTSTIFTMVRFGNVLDSSGSVVRRFRKQIQDGGPVTVTHPEVIRYFMSIPEAAALVIQASAMARGGEVYVLDMGEPVKIDELARTMIRLMGREVQDEANPDGDITIKYTGLRPGEKLFEELLIEGHTTATEHPRIRRNNEPPLPRDEVQATLETLEAAMTTGPIEFDPGAVDADRRLPARSPQEHKRQVADLGSGLADAALMRRPAGMPGIERVAVIAQSPDAMIRVHAPLLGALRAGGAAVLAIAPGLEGAAGVQLEAIGVATHALAADVLDRLNDRQIQRSIEELLAGFKPDAVIASGRGLAANGVLAGRARGVPHRVLILNGLAILGSAERMATGWLATRTLRRWQADAVAAASLLVLHNAADRERLVADGLMRADQRCLVQPRLRRRSCLLYAHAAAAARRRAGVSDGCLFRWRHGARHVRRGSGPAAHQGARRALPTGGIARAACARPDRGAACRGVRRGRVSGCAGRYPPFDRGGACVRLSRHRRGGARACARGNEHGPADHRWHEFGHRCRRLADCRSTRQRPAGCAGRCHSARRRHAIAAAPPRSHPRDGAREPPQGRARLRCQQHRRRAGPRHRPC